MYHFYALQEATTEQLVQCLNLAFSDYEQPICFTPESLNYYLTASGVNLSLSFGAFCDGQLVAVILNSEGIYQGQNVVFDAGTGVIPQHRGKKVFSGLFEYTCEQLRNRSITRYYLETLQSNHHAVSIYSKKGFAIQREFSVLTASGAKGDLNPSVEKTPYGEFDAFLTDFSVAPSFEHATSGISQKPQLYEVLFLRNQAYCIYAKRNGEIIQLHYNQLGALKDVLSVLTSQYPTAMAKNIDCQNSDVIQMLKEIGFVEILKQYEMAKNI